jgi:hypothetical protein
MPEVVIWCCATQEDTILKPQNQGIRHTFASQIAMWRKNNEGIFRRDLAGVAQLLQSVKTVCYTAVGTSNLCNGTGRAVSFDECHLGV